MPVEKRVSAAPMKLVCGEPGHAPIGEVSVPVEEVDGEGSVKLQGACGAGRGGGERGVGYSTDNEENGGEDLEVDVVRRDGP